MIDAIVKLSQCNRRKQAPAAHVVTRNDLLKYAACARMDASSDIKKAVDVGETSTTDFSDGSEQIAGSTDGSDTEPQRIKLVLAAELAGNPRVRSDRRTPMKPLQWTKTPPGLDAPPGLAVPCPVTEQTLLQGQGTRLSSKAALFVPSFGAAAPGQPSPYPDGTQGNSHQLRQSIRQLKGVLEEWEESHPDDEYVNDPFASGQGQNLYVLQEALARLTPQDAAVVRSLLESKESQQHVAPIPAAAPAAMTPPGQFYCPPAGWPPGPWNDPVGAQGSFNQFQGLFQAQHQRQNNKGHQVKPRRVQIPDDADSLAAHLRDLAEMDSGCVLMVRKINQLEGDTCATLKNYFSKFGSVDRVMISATRSAAKPARIRQATLGFLVMSGGDGVQAALAHGPQHIVQGVSINVSTFESHTINDNEKVETAQQ